MVVGWAVFLGAYPVAVTMLRVTNPLGADSPSIHTIKSGFIVPLLIVGLGIPFIFTKTPKP